MNAKAGQPSVAENTFLMKLREQEYTGWPVQRIAHEKFRRGDHRGGATKK